MKIHYILRVSNSLIELIRLCLGLLPLCHFDTWQYLEGSENTASTK